MTTDDEIFASALDQPVAERLAFLERACAGDRGQFERLRELLSAHGEASGFLRGPAVTREAVPPIEQPGDKLNHYKLVQRIGEGGVGVVWMAQQEQPLRRLVALKILKLGMDTAAVVARFEAERQALALMDHPNIAKVFDAGITASGRPYFVMELVRGVPITKYCDEHQLTTPERLALFIEVCEAVQHAHQKGVIHRDLKPSNILVTENGGSAIPKVIDFGIAKATQGRLGAATVITAFEQFIGTPVYMSPEQADMSSLDVDTRSDIYSLGVLLFELLTGRTPFDAKTIMEGGYRELSRRIRETDPERPSQRLTTLNAETRATVAKSRRTAPAQLAFELRGDLDWIVMRCLEKDRSRRYESASALALDLQRHLRDQPILARPPSAFYLGQKLFRRHRAAMTAALIAAVVVVVGGAFSAWQAVRATRAEREQGRLRSVEKDLLHRAEEKGQLARRRAYAADMNLAQQAVASDNLGLAKRLLDRHRPGGDETDLRGWEWRYLWQLTRSEAAGELARKAQPIASLSVSADQNWVAVTQQSDGGELSVINLRTRQEIRLPAGNGFVQAVFSPTAPLLAIGMSGGREGPDGARVRLWNVQTREVVAEWSASGPLHFSADGRTLLTGGARRGDAPVLWSVPKGERIAEMPAALGSGPIFHTSPDRRWMAHEVVRGARSAVQVLAVGDGRERWTHDVADENVTALAFSPDGRLLAVAAGNTTPVIQVWDVAKGELRATLPGHRTYITALVFWRDGQTLASASTDQTVRLWDLERGVTRRILRGHELEVRSLALLDDQTTLLSGAKDGAIFIWDTTVPEPRRRFRVDEVAMWAFAPDSRAVVILNLEGVVSVRSAPDFARAEEKLRLSLEGGLSGGRGGGRPGARTVLAQDAPLVAAVERGDVVRVYNWQTGQVVGELKGTASPASLVGFTDGGKKLLVASAEGLAEGERLRSWDIATGAVQSLPTTLERGSRSTPSGDGRIVATRKIDGSLGVLDVTTGVARPLPFVTSGPSAPAFSQDGRWLAIPSGAGWVKVWDVSRQALAGELTGFVLGVHGVAFSPDNRRIAAGSGAAEAMNLWDSRDFEPLLKLGAEGSRFGGVDFSNDGNMIGSRNGAGQLHLWVAPTFEQIRASEAPSKR